MQRAQAVRDEVEVPWLTTGGPKQGTGAAETPLEAGGEYALLPSGWVNVLRAHLVR